MININEVSGFKVTYLDTTEDAGLSCNRLDAQVSNLKAGYFIYIYHNYYSENPSVARNASTRQRESGVRRHFLKARLVQPLQRCLAGRSAKSPQGKAKDRAVKPHYASRPEESLPLLWRIAGKGRPKPPPHAGRRGPPLKIWRQRRPSEGRKHHQRALSRRALSPRHAHQGDSPPLSRKLFINSKVWCYSEIHNRDFAFCSLVSSSSQQSSSSGDLRPEMMESETPPTSPLHEAGDTEVSSRRSPDIPKPKASTSAALSPEHLAPARGDEKGPAQFGVQPDTLTGLLERAALLEEHHSLMSMVLKKISSAKSGLNEAFTSLLRGFEVRNVIFSIVL